MSTNQAASPALTYLAIGPHCWGRGATREEAVKGAKQHWPNSYRHPVYKRIMRPQDKHFSIYTSTDPKLYVNDFGVVCAHQPHEVQKIQHSILCVPE